jgi:hypothetical protein
LLDRSKQQASGCCTATTRCRDGAECTAGAVSAAQAGAADEASEDEDEPESHPPLNAQNIMRAIEEGRSLPPKQLTRKLLNVVGKQFPIIKERDDSDLTEQRGDHSPQDPMVSINSMAKRGWDLDDARDGTGAASTRVKQGKHPTCLPAMNLSPEDAALLDKWNPAALHEIMKEQNRYFEHGLHSSKRDVAPGLDPVQQAIITEARANDLFDA